MKAKFEKELKNMTMTISGLKDLRDKHLMYA